MPWHTMKATAWTEIGLAVLGCALAPGPAGLAGAAEGPAPASGLVVLGEKTFWRYRLTCATEQIRLV